MGKSSSFFPKQKCLKIYFVACAIEFKVSPLILAYGTIDEMKTPCMAISTMDVAVFYSPNKEFSFRYFYIST